MWLENLKELKNEKGLSVKKIAELSGLPERTVARIFSGDTPSPYMDTVHRIATVLDGSLDDLLSDSKTVIGSKSLATLQGEVDRLTAENVMLNAELDLMKDKVVTLTAENDLLRTKLENKEEIIRLHNYYGTILNAISSKAEV
jgi:transcriptional regulator with XRE-family HTH domain